MDLSDQIAWTMRPRCFIGRNHFLITSPWATDLWYFGDGKKMWVDALMFDQVRANGEGFCGLDVDVLSERMARLAQLEFVDLW